MVYRSINIQYRLFCLQVFMLYYCNLFFLLVTLRNQMNEIRCLHLVHKAEGQITTTRFGLYYYYYYYHICSSAQLVMAGG